MAGSAPVVVFVYFNICHSLNQKDGKSKLAHSFLTATFTLFIAVNAEYYTSCQDSGTVYWL